jgi:predicted component of type VI protein secretion system
MLLERPTAGVSRRELDCCTKTSMPLILQVKSYGTRPPTEPLSKRFDKQGGTLGRSTDSDLVLPDPHKYISRYHAEIRYREGAYYIVEISGVNPLKLNGRLLEPYQEMKLSDRDLIVIGDYYLQADVVPEQAITETDLPMLMPEPALGYETLKTLLDPAAEIDSAPGFKEPGIDTWLGKEDTAWEQQAQATQLEAGALPRQSEALPAFLKGLSLTDLAIPAEAVPEFMQTAGELLREFVQGTMEVLQGRAAITDQIHSERPRIATEENNPLKLCPTVEEALVHLLTSQGQDYLLPVSAVRAVLSDLKAHELALVEGMRATFMALVQAFDPRALEKQLQKRSVLDTMLPIKRKARLWDLLSELYTDISREIEDNFDRSFGEEIARAYQEQIRQLRLIGSKSPASSEEDRG